MTDSLSCDSQGLARLSRHLGDMARHSSHPLDQDKPAARLVSHVQQAKRFPDHLSLNPNGFRLRLRTDSTRSSISSAHVPDSATTCSASTLASPLSSNYASEIQERLMAHTLYDGPTPPPRIRHGHQPSSATTCSTFINDDDVSLDVPIDVAPSDVAAKLRRLHEDFTPRVDVWDECSNDPSTPLPDRDPVEHDYGCRLALAGYSPGRRSRSASPTYEEDDGDDDVASNLEHASQFDIESDVDGVLDYTLQAVYGTELRDIVSSKAVLRQLGLNFLHGLGEYMGQSLCGAKGGQSTNTTSSSSSTPAQATGGGGFQGGGSGKRKKHAGSHADKGDELSDGEASGCGPVKRTKPSIKDEDNLRLSCPYRKRNPRRFNVRDHHSCAMTYFPKFAELRQHIVKQHKRDDPSAFVCDRCTREFRTRKELRDHQRQPREHMCEVSDHDAESGIDGSTAIKLVSRKRASGMSAETQWREIWSILFPDDDDDMICPYEFTPVIEHFELSSQFLDSFDLLQSSLRNKISNPATLETLATKFHQCFVEAVDSCASVARRMPYANRSNKRSMEPAQVLQSRKARGSTSRPDSGVVMVDDGSEEGGSAIGHRDSVRTVTTTGMRELRPAPSGADYPAEPQMASAQQVQSWTNGVFLDKGVSGLGWNIPDYWMNSQGISYHTDFGGETEFKGDLADFGGTQLRDGWIGDGFSHDSSSHG